MNSMQNPFTLQKVCISGLGIVSSIGCDIITFADSLFNGNCGVIKENNHELAIDVSAKITTFQFEKYLQKKLQNIPYALLQKALHVAGRSPLTIQTSVISALQAWEQARLYNHQIIPQRIGIIVAGHNTTQNYQYTLEPKFRIDPQYLSPRYALQFMDSNQIGVLSETFNIQGESIVCGGSSASGNIGIIQGMRLIQTAVVDVCLVVGVLADLSPMEIQSFVTIGAMAGKYFHDFPEQACRPFDIQHQGFIYGQASACIILESATSVLERGIPALAKLRGGAIILHASASSEPNLHAEIQAMQIAMLQSDVIPTQIDYLNTHGSSSPLGDKIEIQAIERVFDMHFPMLWLNATKGLTGHCLYSAGIVECIAVVIQMQKGFLHPNRNLLNPINATARFVDSIAMPVNINIAMSNSFGFGGINTSIVLQH